jgi:pimeloyl-ACP methyl ester carboxylesterase
MAGDLIALGATATSPSLVQISYAVTGTIVEPSASVAVYRSADPVFDASDFLVGQTTLSGSALAAGSHTAQVALAAPLGILPSQRYVLVVIDPTNQIAEDGAGAKANNTATFRKWVVSAVTHGVELDNAFPAWVGDTAANLYTQGYDVAIPFDWAQFSGIPAPVTGQVAQAMAGAVGQVIQALPLGPGDVVDIHLIGHSRGGGLITQAAAILPTDAPPLAGGFLKLTLLDPHPTRNGEVLLFSSSGGPIGTLTQTLFVGFQAGANDPPLSIPPNADGVEVFYQHTPAPQAVTTDERIINSWGDVPAGGATASVTYYDVTAQTRSHYAVREWYLAAVVPGLAVGSAVPVPSVPRPTAPTTGGPAFPTAALGRRYETALLVAGGARRPVATHTLNSFTLLNRQIAAGRVRPALFQADRMSRFLTFQSGRGIPAPTARSLQELVVRARVLLTQTMMPPPPLR